MSRAQSVSMAPLRSRLVMAMVVLGAAFVGPAHSQAVAPPSSSGVAPDSDTAIFDKLVKTRVDVNYAPEDFGRIIDELRAKHGLNIQVAWSLLDGVGVRKDKRIEIRLTNVPLSTLLDNIVRELDPTGTLQLGWTVDEGIVVISERGALGRRATLRAYDVRDLLESGYAFRRFANTPVLGLQTTGLELLGGEAVEQAAKKIGGTGGGGGGGGGFSGSIFGSPGEDPGRVTRMDRIESLVNLVQNQVNPETWRDAGGDIGGIEERDGVLLVRQTLKAHLEIDELFTLIRSMKPTALSMDAAIVRVSPAESARLRALGGVGFPVLPATAVDALAFGAASDHVLFRATSTGANGQAFFISDLSQSQIVQQLEGAVGQQSSIVLPRLGAINDGLELIVLPLLAPDGASLTLDVQLAWKPSPEVHIPTADKHDTQLDRSRQRMRTVSSTARLKRGDAVALSIADRPHDDGSPLEHDDWLILRAR